MSKPHDGGPHLRLSRRAMAAAATLLWSGAVLLLLPLTSSADLRGGLRTVLGAAGHATQSVQGAVHNVSHVGAGGGSGGGSRGSAGGSGGSVAPHAYSTASSSERPRASYSTGTPAMYGTNPHGQGTVASVATSPSTNVPYSYSPNGSGGEIVVVGRGRSEQNGSNFHSHTTILDLLGNELLGVDAQPGQSNKGPLNAIQTGLLNSLCTGTGMFVCLTVLEADTVASSSGANTKFSTAHATVGGAHGIDAGVAESNSSISNSGNCQTASGSSSTANANIAGGPVASVGKTSDSSTACSGKAPSHQASSSVIGLGGAGVPLPQPGCANGTPNTSLNVLGVADVICNASDAGQAAVPSGVRESLTAVVLPSIGNSLAKTVVSASESHAVAASSGNGGGGNGNGAGNGNTGAGNGNGGGGSAESGDADEVAGATLTNGNGSAGNAASSGSGESSEGTASSTAAGRSLPFTGENVLAVVLVGLLLTAGGIAVSRRTSPAI